MWVSTLEADDIVRVGDVVIYLRRLREGSVTLAIHAPSDLRIERIAAPPVEAAPKPPWSPPDPANEPQALALRVPEAAEFNTLETEVVPVVIRRRTPKTPK